jgi:hypothetical protein
MSPVRSVTHVFGLDILDFGAGEGIRTLDPNLGKVKVPDWPVLPRDYLTLLVFDNMVQFSLLLSYGPGRSLPDCASPCFPHASPDGREGRGSRKDCHAKDHKAGC